MLFAVLTFLFIKETLLEQLKDIKKPKDEIFGKKKYTECSAKLEDDLPIVNADSFDEIKESIFFIEPSCVGDLNSRQACSVESAAVAHPKMNITILFVGPVENWKLQKEPLNSLLLFANIKMFRLNVDVFVKGSPLEPLFKKVFVQSHFSVEYLSQCLRFLTLYKYGGIYLDFDVLVLKPFTSLPVKNNWVAVEDELTHMIGSSQMAISDSSIGKQYLAHIFQLFLSIEFNEKSWSDYCSTIMKKALKLLCGSAMFEPKSKLRSTDCYGLAVYEQSYFYKINSRSPFTIFETKFDIKLLEESYAVNTYNSITFLKPINLKSGYAELMHQHCLNTKKAFKVIKVIKAKQSKVNGTTAVKNQKSLSKSGRTLQPQSDVPTHLSLNSDIVEPFHGKNKSNLRKTIMKPTLKMVKSKKLSLSSDLNILTTIPGNSKSSKIPLVNQSNYKPRATQSSSYDYKLSDYDTTVADQIKRQGITLISPTLLRMRNTTPLVSQLNHELRATQFPFDDYGPAVYDSSEGADSLKRQIMTPRYNETTTNTMNTPSVRYLVYTTSTPYSTSHSFKFVAGSNSYDDDKHDIDNITLTVTVPEQSLSTIEHKTHEPTFYNKYNFDEENFTDSQNETSTLKTHISSNAGFRFFKNNNADLPTVKKPSRKTKTSMDEDKKSYKYEYQKLKENIKEIAERPIKLHLPYLRNDWGQSITPLITDTKQEEDFMCINEICK